MLPDGEACDFFSEPDTNTGFRMRRILFESTSPKDEVVSITGSASERILSGINSRL